MGLGMCWHMGISAGQETLASATSNSESTLYRGPSGRAESNVSCAPLWTSPFTLRC